MSGRDEPDLMAGRREEAARWFSIATDDGEVVRLCLDAYEPKLAAGAYHCQQAIEKLMKGLLVLANVPFSKTHDLRTIGGSVVLNYPDWADLVSATFAWTVWGYAYRYPGPEDHGLPSPEELRRALATFDELATLVSPLLEPGNSGSESNSV
jgi:HEPN domain-containing protein